MVENLHANAGDTREVVGLIPRSESREWQPIPVFLPGKSHGQRSLGGYGPWGCRESTTEQLNHHHPDTEFSALC